MTNQKKSISNSSKAQILLESDDPTCVITQLASKHGITASQIYNWRTKRNQSKVFIEQSSEDDFIELVANDLEEFPTIIAIEHVQIELKFSEFIFSINGKISNKKLHKIIELLSIPC